MNSELRDRSLMVALLLVAWAVLVYLKTVLNASVLPDLDAIIAQVQVLMGGVVGYHVGTGAGAQLPAPPAAAPPAVAPGQGGFHTLRFVLLLAFLAFVAAALSACASLTDAGHSAYSFEPATGADGKATGGYKFSATDGKEYSSRAIKATIGADGTVTVDVQEGASTAFQGQAIAGKALSVLPSFAPILLPPGPATVVPQIQAQPSGPKL